MRLLLIDNRSWLLHRGVLRDGGALHVLGRGLRRGDVITIHRLTLIGDLLTLNRLTHHSLAHGLTLHNSLLLLHNLTLRCRLVILSDDGHWGRLLLRAAGARTTGAITHG